MLLVHAKLFLSVPQTTLIFNIALKIVNFNECWIKVTYSILILHSIFKAKCLIITNNGTLFIILFIKQEEEKMH